MVGTPHDLIEPAHQLLIVHPVALQVQGDAARCKPLPWGCHAAGGSPIAAAPHLWATPGVHDAFM